MNVDIWRRHGHALPASLSRRHTPRDNVMATKLVCKEGEIEREGARDVEKTGGNSDEKLSFSLTFLGDSDTDGTRWLSTYKLRCLVAHIKKSHFPSNGIKTKLTK